VPSSAESRADSFSHAENRKNEMIRTDVNRFFTGRVFIKEMLDVRKRLQQGSKKIIFLPQSPCVAYNNLLRLQKPT
jgi:hypothetical protein